MKLFWISPECPYPPNSGGRVGIWKKIEYLSVTNDVFLYTIVDSSDEYKYINRINDFCAQTKMYERERVWSPINILKYPYPALSRWNNKMRQDIETDFSIICPDVIVVDFPQMAGVLPNCVIERVPIVLNQYNIEYLTMRSLVKSIRNPIKKLLYLIVSFQMYSYEKELYAKKIANRYTFVSESDKEIFEKEYKINDTWLVPIGTETRKCAKFDVSNHNLIFVGKMSYPANEQGAIWLIDDVMSRVKIKIPDVTLYVVGKEPSQYLIKKVGNSSDVVLTGAVENLDEYYDLASVALVPIKTGGGVNVKLLEALGQGKIVITTPKGIEGTLFKHGVHLLVANNTDEFINYCVDALLNPDKFDVMKKNANDLIIKYYSWESIVKRFELQLRDLINENLQQKI